VVFRFLPKLYQNSTILKMSEINIDQATQIRQGEELNRDILNDYLKSQICPRYGAGI
jgi:hypothetical protein